MSSSAPNHIQARDPPPASISTTLISYTSDYIHKTLHPHDEALSSTTKNSDAQGLPPIAVAETQGKFLYLMAKMKGAKKVLEIGTLVSTVFLMLRCFEVFLKKIDLLLFTIRTLLFSTKVRMAGDEQRLEANDGI